MSYIYYIAVFLPALAAAFFYHKKASGRWDFILRSSLDYHRFHLSMIQKDHEVSEKSRELARAMLWTIDKNLVNDESMGVVNLRGILRSMVGLGTSLQILGEIYYQVVRYQFDLDERIIKLLNTLSSTIYRIFFLGSILSLLSLLFMDILFILSFTGLIKSGQSRLYKSLSADRNS